MIPAVLFPETVLSVSVTAPDDVRIPPPAANCAAVLFPETVLPVNVTAPDDVQIPPPKADCPAVLFPETVLPVNVTAPDFEYTPPPKACAPRVWLFKTLLSMSDTLASTLRYRRQTRSHSKSGSLAQCFLSKRRHPGSHKCRRPALRFLR